MKHQLYFLTIIILLLSCNIPSKNEKPSTLDQNNDKSRFKFSSLDVLSFSDLKFKKNNTDCNLTLLFPEDMKKWSNHFLPKEIFEQELYEGYYYSIQDSTLNYQLISLFCSVDDGIHLFLLTINPEYQHLIDFYEIGTKATKFIESKENLDIYEVYDAKAKKMESNRYEVIRKTEIHYDFKDEKKNDSIILKTQKWDIKISEKGTFSKI